MTPLALALNSALLHLVWQGMVVAFLLWIALAALRRNSASVRYAVSCVALGVLALAPSVTMCLVYQRRTEVFSAVVAGVAIPIGVMHVGVVHAGTSLASANWIAPVQAWALPVWACGVALLSMRLLWGYTKVSALKHSGDPAEPAVLAVVARLSARVGVTRGVRVLISSVVDASPCVIGALRPVILLPAATLLGLTPAQLEAVLAHELAHVRRYDYLVNIVQMLIETLFFYHPAVWWISGRIRQERELCCDDIAVRCCGDAVSYARALTALERIRLMASTAAGPRLALGAQDGPLMYRIQRLLGAVPRQQGPSRLPGIVAILLAAACFPAGLNRVHAQAPAPMRVHLPPVRLQVPNATPPAPVLAPAQLGNSTWANNGVTVDLQGAKASRITLPTYPRQAQAANIQGSVYLEVTIDQSGDVSDARVLSGPQELRKGALQSVLNWHFTQDAAGTTRQVSIAYQPPPYSNPLPPAGNTGVMVFPNYAVGLYGEVRTDALKNQLDNLMYTQRIASAEGAAQLQEKIESLRATLGQQQRQASQPSDPTTFAGQPLGDIRILGVTDFERDQLLAKIPLFIRHPLTAESITAALQAVHDFDANATAYFTSMGFSEVALVIQVP